MDEYEPFFEIYYINIWKDNTNFILIFRIILLIALPVTCTMQIMNVSADTGMRKMEFAMAAYFLIILYISKF